MQTTLTTWLNKPVSPRKAQGVEQAPKRQSTDLLPTPPPEQEEKAAKTETCYFESPIPTAHRASLLPAGLTASSPHPSSPQPLNPNISLEPLIKARLSAFKRLNSLLLPIPYQNKFYDEIFTDPVGASVTFVAVWHDDDNDKKNDISVSCNAHARDVNADDRGKLIAGVRCRILTAAGTTLPSISPTETILYISTLTLLSPYRGQGIATHLLSAALSAAEREDRGVTAVCAHVWEANDEALAWYARRGFRVVGREEGYYRRLTPGGAVLVRRQVGADVGG